MCKNTILTVEHRKSIREKYEKLEKLLRINEYDIS